MMIVNTDNLPHWQPRSTASWRSAIVHTIRPS